MTSWEQLTWDEVEGITSKLVAAVLPVGSVEQHGLHLPLGLDYLVVDELARRVVIRAREEGFEVLKLPPIPYGLSSMWLGNPGTINVRASAFMNYVADVIRSVIRCGVRRVLILNGHAGNSDALRVVAREVADEVGDGGYVIVVTSWWDVVGDVINEVFETKFFHADEVETSIALALGIRVKVDRAVGGPIHRYYDDFWHSLDLTKRPKVYTYRFEGVRKYPGGFGSPGRASVEKGDKVVKTLIERLVKLIKDLSSDRV